MRELGIQGVSRRRSRVRTTTPNKRETPAPSRDNKPRATMATEHGVHCRGGQPERPTHDVRSFAKLERARRIACSTTSDVRRGE